MTEKHPSLEEALFELAAQKPAGERASFLDGVCRDNPALRARLEVLLEGHFAGEGFLADHPDRAPCAALPAPELPAQQLGRYKLLEKIGEGGFGEVWMAEQREPIKRRVALKIIKLGMDSRQIIARFEAERQALAMMDHPNIARILDADVADSGRPYFVMELVRGIKVTDYCDQSQLPTRERLQLFTQVCQAIQHAHQKGIIHRDIKPSNILVTMNDGVPVPKVIDFGIAKATQGDLTDKTVFTLFQQFIGTPAYISPEQAELSSLDIDTRADIYSLGVLLYELLVGQTPFDTQEMLKGGLDSLRQIIREKEPLRPSTKLNTLPGDAKTTAGKRRRTDVVKLVHQLQGDLDWIVMKCLEKDRSRRYDTANGLAADIQRHLHNEPIVARPPSTAYRIQKAWQRNKLAFSAAAAVVLALILGLSVSTWQAVAATQARRTARTAEALARSKQSEAETERSRAEKGEADAKSLLYLANLNLAQSDWERNNVTRLAGTLKETMGHEDRGFEWFYWARQLHRPLQSFHGHLGHITSLSLSSDGGRLVTAGQDRQARIWDTANGRELFTLAGHHGTVHCALFSPDGNRVVTVGADQSARIWDATSGRVLHVLKGHGSIVFSAAISPDGSRVATGGEDGVIRIWDILIGSELMRLDGSDTPVLALSYSPDGTKLACGLKSGAELRDIAGPKRIAMQGIKGTINTVAFSPDGHRIVTGGDEGTVRQHDAASGAELLRLRAHSAAVSSAAYSRDGRQIITGAYDQTAVLWDSDTGEELGRVRGHTDGISSVAFLPDGRRVATGSQDGTARIWSSRTEYDALELIPPPQTVLTIAVSPDGRRLITGGIEGELDVWDSSSGQKLLQLLGHADWVRSVAFSPDGRKMASGCFDRTARIWDAATGKEELVLTGHAARIMSVAFSPDNRHIATASYDRTVKIWDASNGREEFTLRGHTDEVWSVAISRDGKKIASGGLDRTARIWNALTGAEMFTLSGHTGAIVSVSFSPDGRHLVTSSSDRTAKVWEAESGRLLRTFKGHSAQVSSAIYFPDNRRIITSGDDRRIRVWDAATGREILSLRTPPGSSGAIALFPDGRKIVGGAFGGSLGVWEAASPDQVAVWNNEERLLTERMAARARESDVEDERERGIQARGEGAIRQWLVLAPIPILRQNVKQPALEQIHGERLLRPRAGDRVRVDGRELIWQAVTLTNYVIDFNQVIGSPNEHSVGYAVSYLYAPHAMSGMRMRVGLDDTGVVYLNGQQVHHWVSTGSFQLDRDMVTDLSLNEGPNVLVFKVVNASGHWSGSIRLTDDQGRPATNIQVSIKAPEAAASR